ncbi:MAG: TolC family protein [Gammaproteobacteria bacterium]|nr:TolC family protein [Gammaproteobacteria bacterium]
MIRCFLLPLLWLLPGIGLAAKPGPLPATITLKQAISMASAVHPELESVRADMDAARARRMEADAAYGTRLTLEGRLQVIEPSHRSIDESHNDSSAKLYLSRRLYDFGYTDSRRQAADLLLQGREWEYLDVRQRLRLEIIQRYFDVLLADLEFGRDNEIMALAFVRLERGRDQHELGRISDIELLELESRYQESRRQRFEGESKQRSTRSWLAIALGRPDDLPQELVMPKPPDLQNPLPSVESLVAKALEESPSLRSQRSQIGAAQRALSAARAVGRPILRGEVVARTQNRTTSSTHPLSVGLVLEVPLGTGGKRDAEIAASMARLRKRRAELAQMEMEIHQLVLDQWLELDTLRSRLQELESVSEYRELYLDRSRALYGLEVKAGLGDAMVQTSTVQLQQAKAQFRWMLASVRLQALTGRLLAEENMMLSSGRVAK